MYVHGVMSIGEETILIKNSKECDPGHHMVSNVHQAARRDPYQAVHSRTFEQVPK